MKNPLPPSLVAQWHPVLNGGLLASEASSGSAKKAWWLGDCGHAWEAAPKTRLKGNGCPFCSNRAVLAGFNDLATTQPEIATQWHPTKNGDLTPQDVTEGSKVVVWWVDEHGHEWDVQVKLRRQFGCPICSGKRILPGFNDLATKNPSLAAEWHPDKNAHLDLATISPYSHEKVWWLGVCGHEWSSELRSRFAGKGCPLCKHKYVKPTINDLVTTHPAIAAEFHPAKNGTLRVESLTTKSNRKVWWLIASCGHEFESYVFSRTNGAGCSVCTGKVIIPGVSDLATTHPILAAQWHPTKNGTLKPTEVTAGSNSLIWWLDSYGHEWQVKVSSRIKKDSLELTSCPICINKVVLAGFNDLATTHPALAAQWHATKNDNLTPFDVTAGSTKRVWWSDEYGHEWEASVSNRGKGTGCPTCAGYYTKETQYIGDDLAAQWHPIKNQSLEATDVTKGSDKMVWWLGECGHEWEANVNSRTLLGRGCGYCSGNHVLVGYNDFASSNPLLAVEFHPTKNEDVQPTDFTTGSNRMVWWLCSAHNHEWQAMVSARVRGNGCPECAVLKQNFVSKPELELFEFLTKLGFAVEQSNRKVLGNRQEIDLFIPEKQFGIEFNGLYWHSESAGKGRNYHKDKYDAAKAAGVQLLQIWEDDWRDRKPVILRALAHKLGVTSRLAELYPELNVVTSKVFARKTSVAVLSTEDAKLFLGLNHVQGFASGSYYLGLKDAEGVVKALMVLKKEAGETLNIVRYATAGSVTGGFTKLLKHATKTYLPSSFITFADHTISDGGLYESHGFEADRMLSPDYMYVVGGERKHKFGYRLKRFKNDDSLVWQEGLTERELALLNNLPRIWDAGKTRYRLTVK